jgi:hypothetical protein
MKKEVFFVCSICGKEAKKNEEQSNKNWSVFDNKPCVYCGGDLTIKIVKK